ncbi:helix-turn-helix domain-containing protein [Carnobacterium gallinarum]|uniref:helix-turn-helix domain-containing protein n=1 Tax=Carnobacterium gallinarum TaxID=2749 RepID=UPI0005516B9C|nr:helix-turn-helix domain-containing protein [Carnobacterium gallinarum]
MHSFLSKTDIRKLLLITTIEENFQQKVSIADIKKRMDVSEFILFSTFEELKQDIESYQLSDDIHIEKSNQTFKLKKNISFSTEVLKNIYVKNSLGFQIIQDVFEETFTNSSEYAKLFYTSRTKVYNKVNQLKATLEELGIKLSSRFKLAGDEVAIRVYMSNLYTYVYGNDYYPFSTNFKKQVLHFVKNVEEKTGIYLTQASKIKLLYFVSICQIRTENKKNIKIKPMMERYSEDKYLNKIIKEAHHLSFNEKINQYDADLLVQFIKGLNEFPLVVEQMEPDLFTKFFITEFQTYFGEIEDESLSEDLTNGLMKIHYPILTFKRMQTELDVLVQARFVEENYPEVLEFCHYLIAKAAKSKKLQLVTQNDIHLLNRYLFLLINLLPTSFFSIPIKVCIDFTLGENYNNFIYRNIQTFDFINIEISNQLTDDIDILLCDYTLNDMRDKLKVIVWSAPPTAGDWAVFGKCIAKARNDKLLKKGEVARVLS